MEGLWPIWPSDCRSSQLIAARLPPLLVIACTTPPSHCLPLQFEKPWPPSPMLLAGCHLPPCLLTPPMVDPIHHRSHLHPLPLAAGNTTACCSPCHLTHHGCHPPSPDETSSTTTSLPLLPPPKLTMLLRTPPRPSSLFLSTVVTVFFFTNPTFEPPHHHPMVLLPSPCHHHLYLWPLSFVFETRLHQDATFLPPFLLVLPPSSPCILPSPSSHQHHLPHCSGRPAILGVVDHMEEAEHCQWKIRWV